MNVATVEPKRVAHFIQKLHTEYDKRRYATQALIKIGKSAVEPLILALTEDNVFVRRAVAQILGSIGDARAVEPLLKVLKDTRFSVREAVSQALAEIGDVRAIVPLRCAVKDETKWECQPSLKALEKLGAPETRRETGRCHSSHVQRHKASCPVRVSDTITSVDIIAQLKHEVDWQTRQSFLMSLVTIGTAAVIPIVQALQDPESNGFRCDIIQILGKIKHPLAIGPLTQLLSDKDQQVRAASAQALAVIEDRKAPEATEVYSLICSLRDERALIRGAAECALSQIGHVRAIQPLLSLFRDKQVQPTAYASLARFAVSTYARTASPTFVCAAYESLAQFAVSNVPTLVALLVNHDLEMRRCAEETLVSIGQPIADTLLSLVQSCDPDMRSQAIRILGRIKCTAANKTLIEALKDDDWQVRLAALHSIHDLGREVADLRAIVRITIDDPIPFVRLALVDMLWDWRNPELLTQALTDADPQVHGLAKNALIDIGTPALEPLHAAFHTGDTGLHDIAAQVLFEMESRRLPNLHAAPSAEEDDEPEEDADAEYGKLHQIDLVDNLTNALRLHDWIMCLQILQECEETGDESVVRSLCVAHKNDDDYIQDAAMQAIRAIHDRHPHIFPKLPIDIRARLSDPVGTTIGETGTRATRKKLDNHVKYRKTNDRTASPSSLDTTKNPRTAKSMLQKPPGLAKPRPPQRSNAVTLNMELVEKTIAETVVAASLLDSIFQEEIPTRLNAQIPVEPQEQPSTLKQLDNANYVFVRMLAQKSSWPAQDVSVLATSLGLMSNGTIERLNEMACEICGEPLTEGDDPVEVNIKLIEELIA